MRVLYVSHYGLLESLGQAQILPYLTNLACHGYELDIISFEKPHLFRDCVAVERQRDSLTPLGIRWFPRPYHGGSSAGRLLADVLVTSREIQCRCRRDGIDFLHCRAHIPGLMALAASRRLKKPMLLDIRGLLAEEYVDAGLWKSGGLKFKAAKALERLMMRRAAAIVVLTRSIRDYFRRAYEIEADRMFVIPTCTDLSRYAADTQRQELMPGRALKVVYSGTTMGRYNMRAMLQFFGLLLEKRRGSTMTVLASNNADGVRALIAEFRLPAGSVTVQTVPQQRVPAVLEGHDLGLIFYKGHLALRATSPTKLGEFLASGIPVVAEERLGDVQEILLDHGVGSLVDSGAPDSWPAALDAALALCDSPGIRQRCLEVARKYQDLSRGVDTYARAYEYCAAARI